MDPVNAGAPAPSMAPTPPPDMAGAPMMQGAPATPATVTPEEKQILVQLLQKVQARMQNFHATNFAAKQKVDVVRRQLLKQVFDKLQLIGVDLTSRESVAAFISKLQEQNPQLANQFEIAMNALLGGQPDFMEPKAQPPMGADMNSLDENAAPPQAV